MLTKQMMKSVKWQSDVTAKKRIRYGEFLFQTDGWNDAYKEALSYGILESLKLI